MFVNYNKFIENYSLLAQNFQLEFNNYLELDSEQPLVLEDFFTQLFENFSYEDFLAKTQADSAFQQNHKEYEECLSQIFHLEQFYREKMLPKNLHSSLAEQQKFKFFYHQAMACCLLTYLVKKGQGNESEFLKDLVANQQKMAEVEKVGKKLYKSFKQSVDQMVQLLLPNFSPPRFFTAPFCMAEGIMLLGGLFLYFSSRPDSQLIDPNNDLQIKHADDLKTIVFYVLPVICLVVFALQLCNFARDQNNFMARQEKSKQMALENSAKLKKMLKTTRVNYVFWKQPKIAGELTKPDCEGVIAEPKKTV